MNGDLEALMHGHNKLIFENGQFILNENATHQQQEVLCVICRSIMQIMNEPVIF